MCVSKQMNQRPVVFAGRMLVGDTSCPRWFFSSLTLRFESCGVRPRHTDGLQSAFFSHLPHSGPPFTSIARFSSFVFTSNTGVNYQVFSIKLSRTFFRFLFSSEFPSDNKQTAVCLFSLSRAQTGHIHCYGFSVDTREDVVAHH